MTEKNLLNNLVSVTMFNQGQASKIFNRLQEEKQIVVLKNNIPTAVLLSPNEYPTLYNNLKGWIRKITKSVSSITFEVEVDMPLNEFNAGEAGFELLDCDIPGHSLIRFSVDHYVDDDTVERDKKAVVPFQVAYAISIHKAQGLEYESVKVIITNQIEELITHNIFYTAITRARKQLKIYWTPETQQKLLTEIKPISVKRDAYILSNKYKLQILNNPT